MQITVQIREIPPPIPGDRIAGVWFEYRALTGASIAGAEPANEIDADMGLERDDL